MDEQTKFKIIKSQRKKLTRQKHFGFDLGPNIVPIKFLYIDKNPLSLVEFLCLDKEKLYAKKLDTHALIAVRAMPVPTKAAKKEANQHFMAHKEIHNKKESHVPKVLSKEVSYTTNKYTGIPYCWYVRQYIMGASLTDYFKAAIKYAKETSDGFVFILDDLFNQIGQALQIYYTAEEDTKIGGKARPIVTELTLDNIIIDSEENLWSVGPYLVRSEQPGSLWREMEIDPSINYGTLRYIITKTKELTNLTIGIDYQLSDKERFKTLLDNKKGEWLPPLPKLANFCNCFKKRVDTKTTVTKAEIVRPLDGEKLRQLYLDLAKSPKQNQNDDQLHLHIGVVDRQISFRQIRCMFRNLQLNYHRLLSKFSLKADFKTIAKRIFHWSLGQLEPKSLEQLYNINRIYDRLISYSDDPKYLLQRFELFNEFANRENDEDAAEYAAQDALVAYVKYRKPDFGELKDLEFSGLRSKQQEKRVARIVINRILKNDEYFIKELTPVFQDKQSTTPELSEVLRILKEVENTGRMDPSICYLRSLVYFRLGDYKKALKSLRSSKKYLFVKKTNWYYPLEDATFKKHIDRVCHTYLGSIQNPEVDILPLRLLPLIKQTLFDYLSDETKPKLLAELAGYSSRYQLLDDVEECVSLMKKLEFKIPRDTSKIINRNQPNLVCAVSIEGALEAAQRYDPKQDFTWPFELQGGLNEAILALKEDEPALKNAITYLTQKYLRPAIERRVHSLPKDLSKKTPKTIVEVFRETVFGKNKQYENLLEIAFEGEKPIFDGIDALMTIYFGDSKKAELKSAYLNLEKIMQLGDLIELPKEHKTYITTCINNLSEQLEEKQPTHSTYKKENNDFIDSDLKATFKKIVSYCKEIEEKQNEL